MSATHDSRLGHGTSGSPQRTLEEQVYPQKEAEVESAIIKVPAVYAPSPKHELGGNWGTLNPIRSTSEGQALLDNGYKVGRQIYNITSNGEIVKFQPDGTLQNGYHAYQVSTPRDIPAEVLKSLLRDGKISRSDYNRLRKGKR